MPTRLVLPTTSALAAAVAEAPADGNACAAPASTGVSSSVVSSGRTAALFEAISAELATQRAAGVDVGASQDAASFAALDAALRRLLADYCADPAADWQRYAYWGSDHYVRNLVACEEGVCELIVICWAPGQVSRVHNHGESHCWMTCLSGGVEEHRFALPPGEQHSSLSTPRSPAKRPDLPGVLAAESPCPRLEAGPVTRLAPGQTAYICDNIALHAVRCGDAGAAPRGGVSLHLYAPPIRRTRLYEPDADRVTLRAPGFFSAGGVPLAAHGAAAGGAQPPAPSALAPLTGAHT